MSHSSSNEQSSSKILQQIDSTNKSQSKLSGNYQQDFEILKHESHMMRVAANLHLKHAENIWKLQLTELQEYFSTGGYRQLPHSPINVEQLFKMQKSKISRSENKCYFGQIANKKKEGLGIAIYREGKIYEGNFHDNDKSGFGVQVYSNGNLYIGNYSQNKKHGKGSFFWFSLSDNNENKNTKQNMIEQYHGDWWGGLPDGYGEHHKNNGDFYIGRFKNGLKHGDGVQLYGNGDKYKGQFINGLTEGYGEYTWNDGSFYKGDFKQGSRNGYGIWKGGNDTKEQYKGHYMIDKKHGYGIYDWGNGYVYKGFFLDDLRYGEGELLLNGQLEYSGYWENGEKVDEKPINYPPKEVPETTNTSFKESGLRMNSQQKMLGTRTDSRIKTARSKRRNCSADKKNRNSKQEFELSIKKQSRQNSHEKSRVGHRNCIPCQQIGKLPKPNWKP